MSAFILQRHVQLPGPQRLTTFWSKITGDERMPESIE
jgi:hypothetical protein